MSSTKLMTFELIDRLNLLVSGARTIPLSNRVMVDKDELLRLMQQLEQSIPNDLQQARQLLAVEQQIIDESRRQAEDTTKEANQKARTTVDSANSQAQATLADARTRANAVLADAQARAQQMVADSEIIARAQAEAQELLESAHRECEDYTMRVHGAVAQMMEQADDGLSQQLDALRALRQEITVHP